MFPAVAVTTTLPAEDPAVTVTCATPLELVEVLVEESVAGPVTDQVTGTLATEPLDTATWTCSGVANCVPTSALWLSPAILVRVDIEVGGTAVTVNVVETLVLLAEVAFIVTAPFAVELSVTLVLA
jgi:hypothetical protein